MKNFATLNIKTVEGLAQTAYLVFYVGDSDTPYPLDGVKLRGSIAQGQSSIPMTFAITGENTATMSWPQMKAGSCRYDVFMEIAENNEVFLFKGIFTFEKRVTPWLAEEIATPDYSFSVYMPTSQDSKVIVCSCSAELAKQLVAQAQQYRDEALAAAGEARDSADRAEEAVEAIEAIGIDNLALKNAPNNFSVKQELDAGANINADSLFTGIHTFERMGGDGYLYRLTINGANGAKRNIVFEQINPDTGAFANRTILEAGSATTNQLYLNLSSTNNNAAQRRDQVIALIADRAGLNVDNIFTGTNTFNKILVNEISAPDLTDAIGQVNIVSETHIDQNMFFAPQKGVFGTEEGTGRQFNLLALRTYNAGTPQQLTQLEIGSEQDHANINSIDAPTWESPSGKKTLAVTDAFADYATIENLAQLAISTSNQLGEKANTSDLGTAAFEDIGSTGNWSQKIVATDVNGLIPPELLPPDAGKVIIEIAIDIAEVVAQINTRTGVIEGTEIEVLNGDAKGFYVVIRTKPAGQYTTDDIEPQASFSGVETITLNGDEHLPVNGNVDLGTVVIPADLTSYIKNGGTASLTTLNVTQALTSNITNLTGDTFVTGAIHLGASALDPVVFHGSATIADDGSLKITNLPEENDDVSNKEYVDSSIMNLAVAVEGKLDEKVPLAGNATITGLKTFSSLAVTSASKTLFIATSTGGDQVNIAAPTRCYDTLSIDTAPTLPTHAARLADLGVVEISREEFDALTSEQKKQRIYSVPV